MTGHLSSLEPGPTARPGRRPLAAPAVGYAGALLAIVLLAAAAVALRDAAVSAGWLSGTRWIDSAIEWLDGVSFAAWMIPMGIVALLLGVWLLILAVLPRRPTAVRADTQSSVWIEYDDLARAATRLAATVPGVLHVRSKAKRRRIRVVAEVTDPGSRSMAESIENTVRTGLSEILTDVPAIRTRTRTGGH